MLRSKKGAALLQVLLVTVVLAGMATMILRASLTRTSTARKMHRAVSSRLLLEACQAEVNALWSSKSMEAFTRDLDGCWMTCPRGTDYGGSSNDRYPWNQTCPDSTGSRSYTCKPVTVNGVTYTVTAKFTTTQSINGKCTLQYTLTDDQDGTEVVL
ncbi:MAG: hypothetical protein MJ053_05105 [Elusimicrobiaceae bacterium]|nr:hypothetical protein [Elusimicrobiaceae bacterium]